MGIIELWFDKSHDNLSCPIEQLTLNLKKMNEKKKREIILYEDHFTNFYNRLNKKVKDKIIWTFRVIETLDKIPFDYFRSIENSNGLFEIRISQGTEIFRIFCFFSKGNLVVLANGFQKKRRRHQNFK